VALPVEMTGILGGLVMRKLLLGSVGLAAMLAGPAMAADMPVAPPPPPLAVYDWTGAYVGFNVGGTWYDVDRHFLIGATPTLPTDPDFGTSASDGIYGFHAGAQWQWGAWVLGVEAALSGCFHECRSHSGALPLTAGFPPGTFGEHQITNLFTVGPRLGYAWDRLLIFATGGWASAELKGTYCDTFTGTCDGPASAAVSGASRNSGWYAGGGFDYMVHKGPLVDVILGVEYQHYDVDGESAFCGNPGCNPPTLDDLDLSATGDLVRARLTIKTQGYAAFWR
jgi:outer membrane immunogenic protein